MAGLWEQGKGSRWQRWGWGLVSVLVHAGLLAALVVATDHEGELVAAESEEEVTFVDISSFPPPPPPQTTAQPEPQPQQPQQTQPQPTQPRPTPRPPTPETPPRATDIVEPESDSLPEPLGDIAPPAPVAGPVAEGPPAGAVTGSQAGGQAGGVEGGVEGGRVGGQVGATGPPDDGGTYVAAVVDRKAELRNRRELPRIMERLYPDVLKEARIGGRVVVQFVVTPEGQVDMGTVKIMSAEHDGLVDATRRALREFRFSPARMGDRTVRMLTQMPIVWQVQ